MFIACNYIVLKDKSHSSSGGWEVSRNKWYLQVVFLHGFDVRLLGIVQVSTVCEYKRFRFGSRKRRLVNKVPGTALLFRSRCSADWNQCKRLFCWYRNASFVYWLYNKGSLFDIIDPNSWHFLGNRR